MKNKFTRDAARGGRFGRGFGNRDFARVRFARWAPDRAWRRGLRAVFVPWGIGLGIGGAVFWPYAYVDLFNYTFWPAGYYGGYWASAYDDLFDGIWWAEEPSYVAEASAYQPVSSSPAPAAGAAAGRTQGQAAQRDRTQDEPARRTEATAGEGACGETGRGVTAWPFDRIQSSLNLSSDQQDLLDALRDAAVQAADAMRDSCPRSVPRNPVERLQTMLERLEATLEALKIVRPALESFYDSLSADQQRRFEAIGPKLATSQAQDRLGADASACSGDKPGLANFPITRIQETVSPTDDQLDLLDALEDATFKAIDIMKAACPEDPPASPSERLSATQTRIEAMIEAARVIQPALEDFYAALSDQQKAHFSKMKS
ncbi:MAG: Spy/CpxP family protein refolding chaperone [Pseudorhodoplanes sp.]|uniref:Spy/CpxP family protein refolding chaperone n=1 Tax=Pseudorhodoplanes sp. TaxID=1934341 RepID=UPI003D0DCAA2